MNHDRFPVLFIAHGAPDILLQADPLLDDWSRQVADLPRPRRILVVSAHWETPRFTVSGNRRRHTIHDFHGFPPELYAMRYPAPEDTAWAERLAAELGCRHEPERGLDHGAWVPLKQLYPEADIPVTLLSVSPNQGVEAHAVIGRKLRSCRSEGVLIVASGVVVHNLSRLNWRDIHAAPEDWACSFMGAVQEAVAQDRGAQLVRPMALPGAQLALPSLEHYLPLVVAQAAADGDEPRLFAEAWRYGNLSQHSVRWG